MFSVLAFPRNQRYLRNQNICSRSSRCAPGQGLCLVLRQRQNASEIALEVDRQLALLGRQDDCVDQCPKNLRRLRLAAVAGQRCVQLANPAVIDLGHIGMEERRWAVGLRQLGLRRLLSLLQGLHVPDDGLAVAVVQERFQELLQLSLDPGELRALAGERG